MPRVQNPLPEEIKPLITQARIKALATGEIWFIVRLPDPTRYKVVPSCFYEPTNRRKIIEFIVFPDKRRI